MSFSKRPGSRPVTAEARRLNALYSQPQRQLALRLQALDAGAAAPLASEDLALWEADLMLQRQP
jgi:hypothetical protein